MFPHIKIAQDTRVRNLTKYKEKNFSLRYERVRAKVIAIHL